MQRAATLDADYFYEQFKLQKKLYYKYRGVLVQNYIQLLTKAGAPKVQIDRTIFMMGFVRFVPR